MCSYSVFKWSMKMKSISSQFSLLRGNLGFKTIIKHFSAIPEPTDLKDHQKKIMGRGLPTKRPIEGVQHIILVSSGKGGVGKSTTSVNLAAALRLAFPEMSIGLLDADIFGPSVPLMMNLHDTPLLNNKNLMVPLINYGVKCMSMGFLIEEGSPVIWRGLMVMQALDKLLRQVDWGSVDFLIVDTPPGTGVVLVTTPQPAALQVTKRGAVMYKKLEIPIIGLVENMASITCPSCSNSVKIFGEGTENLAFDICSKIIASFPLDQTICLNTDAGTPVVIKDPDTPVARSYMKLASTVVEYFNKEK